MKRASALFTLVLLATTASALDAVSEYSLPSSALVMTERSDGGESGHYATFKGIVTLLGTLVIEFDRLPDTVEDKDTTGAAFFIPDGDSKAKLPAAVGHFYPRSVDVIELQEKPEKLLLAAVGTERTHAILFGTQARYEIPAEITIKTFSAWVECDHRIYTAEVASTRALRTEIAALVKGNLIGC